MDKLKCMKSFVLTVEEGNIVGASKKLGITKAAVSKQIIDLEAYLNAQLLQRSTRKIQLTELGKLFYDSTKKVFSAVDEAITSITQTQENPTGLLRITSHRYFGERYISKYLKEFLEIYPEIRIDLELADRFPDLEKENIDLLFGVPNEGTGPLIRKKIALIDHVLCASPNYLKKFGTPKTPQDLKSHRYITHAFRYPDNYLLFKNDQEIYLDYFVRINDPQTMLNYALNGLGFIKIHHYFVDEALKKGDLVEILTKYREPQKIMFVFYKQQKFIPAKITAFLKFIYEKMNNKRIVHD